MIEGDPNMIAEKVLTKLSKYYLQENVEEVVMNRPEQIWVKLRREDWKCFEAPELTYDYIRKLCKVLANINGALFSEGDLPVVSCELPGAPFRFQAIMGTNVRYMLSDRKGLALAIRALTADTSISFASYGLVSGKALPGKSTISEEFLISKDHIDSIQEVISQHQSIIISGATSTGKTTFTNKVIELIPRDHRVLTVEDVRELTVPHENRVHLMVPRNRSANAVGYETIIDSLMRLTPDWIVCGEISIANAQPVYATMGKGHPVITTVHAGSVHEAVTAFANNMSLSAKNMTLSGDALLQSIRSQIGCIIQIERRDGQRRVVDIVFPSNEEAAKSRLNAELA